MSVKRIAAYVLLAIVCGITGPILLRGGMKQADTSGARLAGAAVNNSASALKTGRPGTVQTAGTASKPDTEGQFTWKVGGPTPDGNVVFADWDNRQGGRVYLLSDYGFMLINEGTYDHPRAVYLLGNLKQKNIAVFRSYARFKRALRAIPRGTKVYLHTVCTAGTAPGIGERTWNSVRRAFQKAHLKFDEEDHVMYCVCGEGADRDPSVPKELKANYVRLYGLKSFDAHFLGHADASAPKDP